jgi:DNA-binding HxlR family transcriptional regulator
MLTSRLRTLECNGVIERRTLSTSPPTVWYALTPVGHDLCTTLTNLVDVTQRLRRKEAGA